MLSNVTKSSLNDFRAAKKELSQRFLRSSIALAFNAHSISAPPTTAPEQNVVGVGVGEMISNGRSTGVMAVKLFVRYKFPPGQVPARHRLLKNVGGLPTDVVQIGTVRKFKKPKATTKSKAIQPTAAQIPNPQSRFRPAQPGSSIGFQDPAGAFTMAGTFGALVKDKSGAIYILSNNHVLADENRLAKDSPIFQPGLLDNGDPNTDQIAKLAKFVTLQTSTPNTVDCALAALLQPSLAIPDVLYIGAPNAPKVAAMQMQVHKFGRTTAYTKGHITSIDTDVKVGYDIGQLVFQNQIIVEGENGTSFSNAGDSGSLIMEQTTSSPVALLFAGSSSHTIANHIQDVLTSLEIQFV